MAEIRWSYPVTRQCLHLRERKYSSYLFSPSALGGEWSVSRLGCVLPPALIGQARPQRLEENTLSVGNQNERSCYLFQKSRNSDHKTFLIVVMLLLRLPVSHKHTRNKHACATMWLKENIRIIWIKSDCSCSQSISTPNSRRFHHWFEQASWPL